MMGYPEIYPGAVNRMLVKAFMPMLPPRFSTMIGELAWNPWQWGDVMPQRRIFSHANRNGVCVEQDGIESLGEEEYAGNGSISKWKFQFSDLLKSNTIDLSDELGSRTDVDMIEQRQDIEPFKQDGTTSNEMFSKTQPKSLMIQKLTERPVL